MKKILALLLTLSVSTTAAGQSAVSEPFYSLITGAGPLSCGKFMEYKAQNDPQQTGLIVQWVWGFMTAYNVRGNFEKKFKRPTAGNLSTMPDSPTVLLFLGNYCQKHALATVLDATVALTKAMGGQIDWKAESN